MEKMRKNKQLRKSRCFSAGIHFNKNVKFSRSSENQKIKFENNGGNTILREDLKCIDRSFYLSDAESDTKTESSYRSMCSKEISGNSNMGSARDRTIRNGLLSYPQELIELYSDKKKKCINKIGFNKLCDATQELPSMRSYPCENNESDECEHYKMWAFPRDKTSLMIRKMKTNLKVRSRTDETVEMDTDDISFTNIFINRDVEQKPKTRKGKDKRTEEGQNITVLKKYGDRKSAMKPIISSQDKNVNQAVLQQKSRISNSIQPAWKPAGSVKVPSTNSVTSLRYKFRTSSSTHAKDKIRVLSVHTNRIVGSKPVNPLEQLTPKRNSTNICSKPLNTCEKRIMRICNCLTEAKRKRKQVESKIGSDKDLSIAMRSATKDICPSNVKAGGSRILSQKSDTSINVRLKTKQRPGAPKTAFKHIGDVFQCNSETAYSKMLKNTSLGSTILLKSTTSKKLFMRTPEVPDKYLKLKAVSTKKDNNGNNNSHCINEDPPIMSCKSEEPQSTVCSKGLEGLQIHEEIPTRDVSLRKLKNQYKEMGELLADKEPFETADKQSRKTSMTSFVLSKDLDRPSTTKVEERLMDSGINVNFDNDSQIDFHYSSVSLANASCMADFSSSSNFVAEAVSSKCCQMSINSRSSSNILTYQGDRDEKDKVNVSSFCDYETPQKCNEMTPKNSSTSMKQSKTKKNSMNTHTLSLKMLKEFLCCQGIDIRLVNKAEQDFKQRHQNNIKICKNLDPVGNRENKVDCGICTLTSTNDVFSQTSLQRQISKSCQTDNDKFLQSLIKHQVVGAQTEMSFLSIKHINVGCYMESFKITKKNETKDVSLMTDQILKPFVNDRYTETSRSLHVSKCVATKLTGVVFSKELRTKLRHIAEEFRKHFSGKSIERFNAILTSYEKINGRKKLSFLKSIETNNVNANEELKKFFIKSIPSEVITAFRIAMFGTCNVHKALNYKWKLDVPIHNEKQQLNTEDKSNTKSLPINSKSVTDDRAHFDINCSNTNREFLHLQKTIQLKIPEANLLSQNLNPMKHKHFEKSDTQNVQLSSSTAVLKDVKSLVEFLLHQIEDIDFEELNRTQNVPVAEDLSILQVRDSKAEVTVHASEFSVIWRECLLPLVYGVVCSIMFWCLQFSIKCDCETSHTVL